MKLQQSKRFRKKRLKKRFRKKIEKKAQHRKNRTHPRVEMEIPKPKMLMKSYQQTQIEDAAARGRYHALRCLSIYNGGK